MYTLSPRLYLKKQRNCSRMSKVDHSPGKEGNLSPSLSDRQIQLTEYCVECDKCSQVEDQYNGSIEKVKKAEKDSKIIAEKNRHYEDRITDIFESIQHQKNKNEKMMGAISDRTIQLENEVSKNMLLTDILYDLENI